MCGFALPERRVFVPDAVNGIGAACLFHCSVHSLRICSRRYVQGHIKISLSLGFTSSIIHNQTSKKTNNRFDFGDGNSLPRRTVRAGASPPSLPESFSSL